MVRKATREDVPQLADVLARSLDDDPVFVALYPVPAKRRRTLTAMFATWLRLLHLPLESAWTTDDLAGGALWSPPGAWRIGLWDQIRMAPSLVGPLGLRAIKSLRVLAAIEARHPTDRPHHYLRLLGC